MRAGTTSRDRRHPAIADVLDFERSALSLRLPLPALSTVALIRAQQLTHPLCKRRRRLTARQPGPLRLQELLGNTCIGFAGLVNHHGHQESYVIRHVLQPPRGVIPFAAEVTLGSRIGVR